MKSLFKIIRRYSVSAGLIVAVILASNVAVMVFLGWLTTRDLQRQQNSRTVMEQIGSEIAENSETGEYVISEDGLDILEQTAFVWAMAIAPDGSVAWEWKLPQNIPRSYTIQDVASFSRWYLEDYPVRVWRSGPLLLVFASDPALESRHSLFMSLEFVGNIPMYLKTLLFVNILVILLFIAGFGWRFYRALKPLAEGIEQLAQEQPLSLKEKGITAELSGKLNHASAVLQQQSRKLEQRDEARTKWISGVSHDIRTPLSLIVGYADRLAESESLNEEEKAMARTIQRQSLIIRQLIQDLNLTSKLAYQSQPLQKEACAPALLLRECVADLYNEGLNSNVAITVTVSKQAEQAQIYADAGLIRRALRNLIGNSIRHNPDGCTIETALFASSGKIFCKICDSGPGIPEQIVEDLNRPDSEVHIMGLRVTAEIAKAHGGVLFFRKRASGTYDAELMIPKGIPKG